MAVGVLFVVVSTRLDRRLLAGVAAGMVRLSDVGHLGRWGGALVDEIAGLPATLERTRTTMAQLPAQLDAVVRALEQTTAALDRTLPELGRAMATMNERIDHVDRLASELMGELARTTGTLERVLPELSGAVGTMDTRLQSLDTTISELGEVIFGLLDAIPGVRRVLKRSLPPE